MAKRKFGPLKWTLRFLILAYTPASFLLFKYPQLKQRVDNGRKEIRPDS